MAWCHQRTCGNMLLSDAGSSFRLIAIRTTARPRRVATPFTRDHKGSWCPRRRPWAVAAQPRGQKGPDKEPDGQEGGLLDNLPREVQQVIALLVQFGGVYGTAAVVLGYLTKVPPLGNLHWDTQDILLGLKFCIPVFLLDAFILLPDHTQGIAARSESGLDEGASGSLEGANKMDSLKFNYHVALEALQESHIMMNPGAGLSLLSEALVVAVSSLADEMLYRAVVLTWLGFWIRDRLYEAGVDDEMVVNMLGGSYELSVGQVGQWTALGLMVASGLVVYLLRYKRDLDIINSIEFPVPPVRESPREPADKTSSDPGPSSSSTKSLTLEQPKELTKQKLLESLTTQKILMYSFETIREGSLNLAAGAAFLCTGNLAASYVGTGLVQMCFSMAQWFANYRNVQKRQELFREAKERSMKLQKAIMEVAKNQEEVTTTKSPDTPLADDAMDPATTSEGQSDHTERSAETTGEGAAGPSSSSRSSEAALILLEDMLKSPQGKKVISRYLAKKGQESASVEAHISTLLEDPVVKQQLLEELEEQLQLMVTSGRSPSMLLSSLYQDGQGSRTATLGKLGESIADPKEPDEKV